MMLDRERGQRRLVEPAQDELLLSRVGIDVTHREYSRHAGLELLGVDGQRLLFQRQAPLRDRSELRVQAEEHQQLIGRQRLQRAVGGADVDATQRAAIDDQRVRLRLEAAQARGRHLLPHPRDRGGRGAELVPTMHQREARGPWQQLQRPVERRVAAAEDHQMLAHQLGRTLHPVVDGAAFESLRALESDAPRLKGAHARRDHHGTGVEADAARGAQVEAPAIAPRELHHFMAEVQLRIEGPDLLHEPVDQLLGAAHRQRRYVVDRLVGVQLGALSAGVPQRIHHLGTDPEEAQLEHLEQPAGTCADDDDLGGDGRRGDGTG